MSATMCLDAHSIWRGTGNLQVALFDVLKLCGSRITGLHLRHSRDNIWTQTFGDGNIDYPALAKYLLDIGIKPHIVLEHAVQAGSPKTMTPVEAIRQSCRYLRFILDYFAWCILTLELIVVIANEAKQSFLRGARRLPRPRRAGASQ